MKNALYFIIAMTLFSLGCEGPAGPKGPVGPQGAGSRIVYEGTATSDEYTVEIPEIDVDDFPLIECYYLFDNAWSAMYLDYPDSQGGSVLPYALIADRQVTLIGLNGLQFKIVIVI